MKKSILIAFALFPSFFGFVSCSKTEDGTGNGNESVLHVSILPQTKASGAGHGVQSDDNLVKTLEIFIFRAEGNDAGALDTYKKFAEEDLTSLSDLPVNTTTGLKHIYAVANSHRENWNGVQSLSQFKEVCARLQSENLKDFTMTGSVEAMLQSSTSVTFAVSRLVARVELSSIKTSFAGTPYQGTLLENVKVYLTNVISERFYADGGLPEGVAIFNSKMAVAGDINGCAMSGMLYEQIMQKIGATAHAIPHYFYCYPNEVEDETDETRFTKLVIQADLNGNTYYYPIPLENIERNSAYSLSVNIMRPGTLDPEQPLEKGVLDVTLNVLDWELHPQTDVEF